MNSISPTKRCAIYCRKSTDEGLDQQYNSLDAQRASCEHYIAIQAMNNWAPIAKHYDDGGYSGGNVNRPALQELMKDIKAGEVDVVVVYKIDRLSRSLLDFADILQVFDEHKVTFVSSTQQIDTSSSAGRMMLNILMTFAQFEREIISERIRDKMSSSRKKGMWMGGVIPFGYVAKEKKLVPNPRDAQTVRFIYSRYMETGSVTLIAEELRKGQIIGPMGRTDWPYKAISRILTNPTYYGKVLYKGELYNGEHDALIPEKLWYAVQGSMASHSAIRAPNIRSKLLLGGLLRCGHCGCAMLPHYVKKKNRTYFYYICRSLMKAKPHRCPIKRVPANEVDKMVEMYLCNIAQSETFQRLLENEGLESATVRHIQKAIPEIWEHFTVMEKQRFARFVLDCVTIGEDGISITVRTEGVESFAKELLNSPKEVTHD